MLPPNIGVLARVNIPLEGVTTLSPVEALDSKVYSRADKTYVGRQIRDLPPESPALLGAWLTDYPLEVEASISEQGTFRALRFVLQAPGEAPAVAVELKLGEFGSPVTVHSSNPCLMHGLMGCYRPCHNRMTTTA